MDLVAHCGDRAGGDFAHTLNTTDIHTQWFEAEACLARQGGASVLKQCNGYEGVLPFELLGIILIMTDRSLMRRRIASTCP